MSIAASAKFPIRLLVLAAAGLVVTLSGCDASSGPTPAPTTAAEPEVRQVTVEGSGEVKGTPDTLNVSASIEFTAPDVTGAMNQVSDRQLGVINALVDAGVDRDDISTTEVSLQPQFATTDSTTIVGYRASNTIDVKIRQLDAASQALALIISTGGNATRINNVTVAIEDDSQLVREARARAFNDARSRAEQYALLAEMDLGEVVSITEESASTPAPYTSPSPRAGAAEMAAVPIEPGQQTVGFNVTVVFELETS